jgi:hypothetical protein
LMLLLGPELAHCGHALLMRQGLDVPAQHLLLKEDIVDILSLRALVSTALGRTLTGSGGHGFSHLLTEKKNLSPT